VRGNEFCKPRKLIIDCNGVVEKEDGALQNKLSKEEKKSCFQKECSWSV